MFCECFKFQSSTSLALLKQNSKRSYLEGCFLKELNQYISFDPYSMAELQFATNVPLILYLMNFKGMLYFFLYSAFE